jgi:hypothetical protein
MRPVRCDPPGATRPVRPVRMRPVRCDPPGATRRCDPPVAIHYVGTTPIGLQTGWTSEAHMAGRLPRHIVLEDARGGEAAGWTRP